MGKLLKKTSFLENSVKIDWGILPLIEFLLSDYIKYQDKFKLALDIGSGDGSHTKIMRKFGLKVDQIDKYSEFAEIKEDFLKYNFKNKYDIVFCSHVIEHQRNTGLFLDKIFDVLTNKGFLIISAPKHDVNRFVEGHLSSWHLTYFIQNLIHAGFDCKKGKTISLNQIENSFIVPKSKNFNFSEREEAGYQWNENHQLRSPFKLFTGLTIKNEGNNIIYNCEALKLSKSNQKIEIIINYPSDYIFKNIEIDSSKHGINFKFLL